MKHSLLRVIADSRHVALNITSLDTGARPTPRAARASQPQARSRTRNRLSRLLLAASVALGLCATSLHAQDAPHGDHNPHHGGVVLMYGLDLHYEVVLTSAGNVELWLSNAARDDLPASVVSDVAAEIERGGTRQDIDMAISDSGDAWVGKVSGVKAEGTTLHLGFVYRGEPAALAFPATSLMGEGREKLVNDTAHAPANSPAKPAPKGHEGHEGHSMGTPGTGQL
ncbi:hypothetical protein [Steroidobacter cummioxidans]|uniref:hypothetical protein n=1 Tax=Steroidobacter cummioxidans TaxID=1803913 RepID=UPI00129084DA|nr:hypothetical protein [Steroidobacter cummioxidans]